MPETTESVRHECALVASAEYEYWKNLPDPGDPIVRAMQMAAMGAAANICANIFLGKTGEMVTRERENPPDGSRGTMTPYLPRPSFDPKRKLPTVRQKEILYALTQGKFVCDAYSGCRIYPRRASIADTSAATPVHQGSCRQ